MFLKNSSKKSRFHLINLFFLLLSTGIFHHNTLANQDKLSVLVKNKVEASENNIHNVTFVSVPFSGHCYILMKYALNLSKHPNLNITFIITGWENITASDTSIGNLTKAGIDVHIIEDEPLRTPAPMSFTFPRVNNLVDKTIELAKNSDLIIYDFFAIEGFLTGKALDIPTICSIPAIIGPFNPNNLDFQNGLTENMSIINDLEKKFNVDIVNNLEMVSDAFLLPSKDDNIIWSWPDFIQGSDFRLNRKLEKVTFVRPENSLEADDFDFPFHFQEEQKVIYVSFGTVVTKNLWNNIPTVHAFVSNIFKALVDNFRDNEKYQFIISTGRNPKDIIQDPPSNFHVFEHVPQVAILKKADLFVTHGGGNSVNEAIDLGIPMIVIPFFGDQHLCALNIKNLKIGYSFLHQPENREAAINTKSNLFERESLKTMDSLIQAIYEVLNNPIFKNNIEKIRLNKPEPELNVIDHRFLFKWQEGDLLYGTNNDRIAFVKLLGLESHFKIGDLRPFSQLFSESSNHNALPRLVDQYNDALRSCQFSAEANSTTFQKYGTYLQEFDQFLRDKATYLQPLGHYPQSTSSDMGLETLWNMCLGGLDFFILNKNVTIHFIIKDYDCHLNKATSKELDWIKQQWKTDNGRIKQNIKFYLIKDDSINLVDPEALNWFDTASHC